MDESNDHPPEQLGVQNVDSQSLSVSLLIKNIVLRTVRTVMTAQANDVQMQPHE